jgi:transposase InsO family protein
MWEDTMLLGYSILSWPESDRVHLHHFMLRVDYRRGNCHDNAVAESLFNLLKRERKRRRT